MTGLALALLAVALGDLLLGIGGEALSADDARGRIGVATGTAALVALTGAGGVGMPAGSAVLLVLTAPLLVLGWTWARRWVASAGDPEAESGRARRVLAGGAALTVAGALTAPAVWRTPPDGWLVDYVALLPTSRSVPVLLLVAAVGLAQVATSNALVRLVLSASGTLREEAPEPVGGGRWIGPAERLVLVLLVLADEITAAGLVTAAKGLLRKDEVAGEAKEYVVLGSLTSLALALVPSLLVRTL